VKSLRVLLPRKGRSSSGGLLMSVRRRYCDSGVTDLWSEGSVFTEPSAPISIDPSPHISPQQTTGRNAVKRLNPTSEKVGGAKFTTLAE
jgi:hypothetical protein